MGIFMFVAQFISPKETGLFNDGHFLSLWFEMENSGLSMGQGSEGQCQSAWFLA